MLFEKDNVYGTRVHVRFNELMRAQGGKFFGETGYHRGSVLPPGSARKWTSAWPDAVYGASPSQPEMLFDLKTGFNGGRGITAKWLGKAAIALPVGFKKVPVYMVTC